jgi:AcrR family transcriptional regulator
MINATVQPDFDLKDEVSDFKKKRIREEACSLFYELGYESTTLDAIAKRLKVTKPFLYKHYDNKGELLFDICRTGIALSLDAVSAACSQPRPSTERLQCLAESVLEVIFEYQKFIVVYTREEKNLRAEEAREIREQRKLFDHQLAELLREGDQTGEFQVSDPLLTANTIGGVVTWVALWYSPDGKRSKLEILTHILEMIFTIVASKKALRPSGGPTGQLGSLSSIRFISPVGGKPDEH